MKKARQQRASEPVTIRFKQLKDGSKSVYLDMYINGKRTYEFLKAMRIKPERTQAERQANKAVNDETMKLANEVKAQRTIELLNAVHGSSLKTGRDKMKLADYVENYAGKLIEKSGGDKRGACLGYMALLSHLRQYKGDQTTFRQIDKNYCTGFIEYIKTAKNTTSGEPLNINTQFAYMKRFETVLNAAISDEIITINPFKTIKPENKPKKKDAEIEFLTVEEVKKLVGTPCYNPVVKQAFLFACFSGLRFSDVKALRWGDIQTDGDGQNVIRYTQKKTKKHEYLQVSNEALKFLPERSVANDGDTIFRLFSNGHVNQVLAGWAMAAGITKRVTFHVSRHTNATLLLSLGVPIETVSKILGHSDIHTTQIYAKVIDKAKRDAVSRLDGLTD